MRRVFMRLGACLVASVALVPAGPSVRADGEPAPEWRTAARGAGLSEKELEAIARDGFVVAGKPDRQVFSPYLDMRTKLPLFVTSDDAPRAAAVFFDPRSSEHWIAGIGRPRRIYVLYPFGGRDHLCLGSVLPFLETRSPTPLTDDEWTGHLEPDDPRRPRPPDWLRPVFPDD